MQEKETNNQNPDGMMKLNDLNKTPDPLSSTGKMPVLFLGHGSPMNAIAENEFVDGFRNIGKSIPKPDAILCVSAHWETRGILGQMCR